VIDRNFQRSRDILTENLDNLHRMAEALMKYETIDADQIDDIMAGKVPRPPVDWDDSEPRTGAKTSGGARDEGGKPDEGTLGTPAGQH
jgi:cell division protease FtsH